MAASWAFRGSFVKLGVCEALIQKSSLGYEGSRNLLQVAFHECRARTMKPLVFVLRALLVGLPVVASSSTAIANPQSRPNGFFFEDDLTKRIDSLPPVAELVRIP